MSFVTKYMNGSIFFSELYTDSAAKFVSTTFRSLFAWYPILKPVESFRFHGSSIFSEISNKTRHFIQLMSQLTFG